MERVWNSASFTHLVLGESLLAGPVPPITVSQPSDAFTLLARQLESASSWPALPEALRASVSHAQGAFSSSLELLRASIDARADAQAAYSFLSNLVSRIRTLGPGESLVLARPGVLSGETGAGGRVLFVVHRLRAANQGCECVIVVCTTAASVLNYHPARVSATGRGIEHATPLVLRDVPLERACDGAFWYLALLAEPKGAGGAAMYERLLPFLNQRPLLSNWPQPRVPDSPSALCEPARAAWRGEGGTDPHGHELATLAAVTIIQLGCEADERLASDLTVRGASYTTDGVALILRHQLTVLALADLDRAGLTQPRAPPLAVGTLELLIRAARRCSASTAARVAAAEKLGAAELRAMISDLTTFESTLATLRRRGLPTAEAMAPPDAAELAASPLLPGFGRLRDTSPVDALAGPRVDPPIVMPVQLSLIPDRVCR